MKAIERVRAALQGLRSGERGPNMEKPLVELFCGDLCELCKQVAAPDEIVASLLKGSSVHAAKKPEYGLAVYVDDAFHLLDQLPHEQPA